METTSAETIRAKVGTRIIEVPVVEGIILIPVKEIARIMEEDKLISSPHKTSTTTKCHSDCFKCESRSTCEEYQDYLRDYMKAGCKNYNLQKIHPPESPVWIM